MKSKYLVKCLLISCFFCSACRESNDQTNIGNTIEIGNPVNLSLQKIDTTINAEVYDRKSIMLDLDSDGFDDIEISGIITGSQGTGYSPSAEIVCLNSNTYINLKRTIDTTFIQIDTSIYVQNAVTYIDCYKKYNCSRITPDDSIYQILENEHINVLSISDIISTDDIWVNDTIKLNYIKKFGPGIFNIEYESADTLIRTYYKSSYFNCDGFPNDKVSYIGVMNSSPGKNRLGYIKAYISDYVNITVFEVALQ